MDQPKKPEVSQKEYLKRYLSKDKGEKKKKKKVKISSSSHLKPSIIVDDDLGLPDIASIEDEEFNLDYLGDEAPQIAGVIDERPPEIKAKENYGDRNKWKSIGESEEVCSAEINSKKLAENRNHDIRNGKLLLVDSNKYDNSDISSLKYKSKSSSKENKTFKERISRNSDSDVSPPRSKTKNKDKEKISVKKRYTSDEDSDISPPRSKIKDAEKDHFSKRPSRHDNESLLSSSRSKNKSHQKKESSHYNRYTKESEPPLRDRDKHRTRSIEHSKNRSHKGSDSDLSPPRKSKYEGKSRRKGSDSDQSPPRKNRYEGKAKRKASDSDRSPCRKLKNEGRMKRNGSGSVTPPRKNKYEGRAKRKGSDSDLSPPRKNRSGEKIKRNGNDSDLSPPRKNRSGEKIKRNGNDSDLSPPRKNRTGEKIKRNGNDSDLSPPRKKIYEGRPMRKGSESDLSPSRKSKHGRIEKSMDKTLDGKKAGLQDARNLKEELRKLKEAENAMFEKMRASVSGKAATTVLRDRKTGKIRDLNKEKDEESKKSAKAAERESKYAKWGRGLKQVAEAEDRITDYLHEVNKPLARYAGDADLEKILKARELQEDPMLDYIKNKQSESIDVEVKGKPSYRGYYLPNRFNIRPGHRWDGVDRSNGYEKQWFERKNAKKALEEEAYKWSTADM